MKYFILTMLVFTANNSFSQAGSEGDFALSIILNSQEVFANDEAIIDFKIQNIGTEFVTSLDAWLINISTDVQLINYQIISSVNCSENSNYQGPRIVCTIPEGLEAGEEKIVTVKLTPSPSESLNNYTISIESDIQLFKQDANSANNSSNTTLLVNSPMCQDSCRL